MTARRLPASALLLSAALLTTTAAPAVRAESMTASVGVLVAINVVGSVGMGSLLLLSAADKFSGRVKHVTKRSTSTRVEVSGRENDEPYQFDIPNDALAGKEVRTGDTVEVTPNEAGLTIRLAEADLTLFAPRPEHAGLIHHERIGAAQ